MTTPATPPHGRLPWFEAGDLTEEQRAVYEAITTGPRAGSTQLSPLVDEAGRLEGPFNSMLVSPRLGAALQGVGAGIRWGTELTARERETAILLCAVAEKSSFEWLAHEAVARAAGLTDDELDAIDRGEAAASFDEAERVVVELVLTLLSTRDAGDELFARATTVLGRVKVVELVTVVGYYQTLSLGLRVFRVPLPAGSQDHWPSDASS